MKKKTGSALGGRVEGGRDETREAVFCCVVGGPGRWCWRLRHHDGAGGVAAGLGRTGQRSLSAVRTGDHGAGQWRGALPLLRGYGPAGSASPRDQVAAICGFATGGDGCDRRSGWSSPPWRIRPLRLAPAPTSRGAGTNLPVRGVLRGDSWPLRLASTSAGWRAGADLPVAQQSRRESEALAPFFFSQFFLVFCFCFFFGQLIK